MASTEQAYAYVGGNPLDGTDPYGLAKNLQRCQVLEKKIINITKDIAKRELDLVIDILRLPETAPGDDVKPSLSKRGHRNIIEELKDVLKRREAEYDAECSDDEETPTPQPAPTTVPTVVPIPVPTPVPGPNAQACYIPNPADGSVGIAIDPGAVIAGGVAIVGGIISGILSTAENGLQAAPAVLP